MNLALQAFMNIVTRRNELQQMRRLNPAQWCELGELEELVTALAGSNDPDTVSRHAFELSLRWTIQ